MHPVASCVSNLIDHTPFHQRCYKRECPWITASSAACYNSISSSLDWLLCVSIAVKMQYTTLLVLCVAIGYVTALPSGPPAGACATLMPNPAAGAHNVGPQDPVANPPPFSLNLTSLAFTMGDSTLYGYMPGVVYILSSELQQLRLNDQ